MQTTVQETLLSFTQLLAILKARRTFIGASVLLFACCAAVLSLLLPKTYIATADVFIDYKVNDPIAGRQFHPLQDESYLQTQFDIIKSVQVAERVIEALHLEHSRLCQRGYDRLGSALGKRMCAEDLVQGIEVVPHKSSRVVEVQFSSHDALQAKEIVNAIVKAYISLSLEMVNAPARARRDQYNEQLQTLSQQIDALQKKITTYQLENKLDHLDERNSRDEKRIELLDARLLDIQMQRVEAQAKQRAMSSLLREYSASDTPEIANIGHISSLKAALVSLDVQMANAKTTLGERHPRYLAIQNERQALLDRLKRESVVVSASLDGVATRLSAQERSLRDELAQYQQHVLENKRHLDIIASYQRQLDSVEKVYNAAIQKFDELLMTSNVLISNSTVTRWAEAPQKHAKPLLKNNLIFGTLAGLIFGFSMAFLLELMARKVRCKEDLEKAFDVPLLASVSLPNMPWPDAAQRAEGDVHG